MYSAEEIKKFGELIDKYRYDFDKLIFILFPFGQKGHDLEHMMPYDWQMNEWRKMSAHLKNPLTRFDAYKLEVSSGNGAAKTAFGAMTYLMLMYTQQVRGRITANTEPQMKSIVWPEYDIWFQRARYSDHFFEKFGTSIKSKDDKLSESWRLDAVTWSESTPAAMSGLHNKGKAIILIFEEAAGIPSIIWQYANGAMSDVDTIKIWLAFANSDDPESQFEQNMSKVDWKSLRIDTRTLSHVDKTFVKGILDDCGGNEDADDFRVRVRGLPRKSSADSIISDMRVQQALKGVIDFSRVSTLPCIMTCDPAWTGGDETTIWIHQGNMSILVDKYKLQKITGDTHLYTYQRMCMWEKEYKVDYTLIDQAEGTALYTMAQAQAKYNWELISFAGSPNDKPEFKDSEYQNIRAQMYYEAEKWLASGGILGAREPQWLEIIAKQLCWTKGIRNRQSLKKQAEAKDELKKRVGQSPDVADGFILRFARVYYDRLPENMTDEMRDVYEIEQEPYDPYADQMLT